MILVAADLFLFETFVFKHFDINGTLQRKGRASNNSQRQVQSEDSPREKTGITS